MSENYTRKCTTDCEANRHVLVSPSTPPFIILGIRAQTVQSRLTDGHSAFSRIPEEKNSSRTYGHQEDDSEQSLPRHF